MVKRGAARGGGAPGRRGARVRGTRPLHLQEIPLLSSPSVWPLLEADARRLQGLFRPRRAHPLARSGRPHDFYVLECSDWANVSRSRRGTRSSSSASSAPGRAPSRSRSRAGASRRGSPPLAAVRRELREETGYAARLMEAHRRRPPEPRDPGQPLLDVPRARLPRRRRPHAGRGRRPRRRARSAPPHPGPHPAAGASRTHS